MYRSFSSTHARKNFAAVRSFNASPNKSSPVCRSLGALDLCTAFDLPPNCGTIGEQDGNELHRRSAQAAPKTVPGDPVDEEDDMTCFLKENLREERGQRLGKNARGAREAKNSETGEGINALVVTKIEKSPAYRLMFGNVRRHQKPVTLDQTLQDSTVPVFFVALQLERLTHERIPLGLRIAGQHRARTKLDFQGKGPNRNRAQSGQRNVI